MKTSLIAMLLCAAAMAQTKSDPATKAPAPKAAVPAAAPKAAAPAGPNLLDPNTLKATAPATYTVKFVTSKGDVVINVTRAWAPNGADDRVTQSNTRGKVTFAQTGAPNSRGTQVFINYGNNTFLDPQRFAPFGEVVTGMEVMDNLYSGYGEGAPQGRGPDQGRLVAEGKAYLDKGFPMLDRIIKATIEPAAPAAPAAPGGVTVQTK
jgi:peptidyl-prolyl cis-trans isomerase A (cyclophilin A)